MGCPSCGSENGLSDPDFKHACCRCADGGRVRHPGRPGQVMLCPGCSGQSANPEIQEYPDERMRIPWKYRETNFTMWLPDNGSPRLRCQSYVAQWPPAKPLLFLTGNRGTGKTSLAISILRTLYARHGKAGQFWLAQRLLDRINATYDNEATETLQQIMTQMERVPLLVIDDFGSEKSTEAARARLFTIVDQRYSSGSPLVVTSNAGRIEVDPRIKSRLSDGEVSEVVQFLGEDMRPKAGAA